MYEHENKNRLVRAFPVDEHGRTGRDVPLGMFPHAVGAPRALAGIQPGCVLRNVHTVLRRHVPKGYHSGAHIHTECEKEDCCNKLVHPPFDTKGEGPDSQSCRAFIS